MKKIFFIAALLLAVSFTSCLKEKAFEIVEVSNTDTTSACSDTVFFATEIMGELLTPSCNVAGCHNSSAAAGYEFTSYASVSANADIVLTTIQHGAGVSAMPLGGSKLNDSLISKFDCWIQQGKLNN